MSRKVHLIGVAGGSGSGKTSLIRALKATLPEGTVAVVSQDDYYLPQEEQMRDANGQVNYDLPTAVDLDALASDLELIASGKTIRRREYTFNNAELEAGWVVTEPAPLVLVEGLFVLHHIGMRQQFHHKVFVHAEEELQLQRRLKRDAIERGYGEEEVRYQWHNHVMPAFRDYLEPYRPLCSLVMNEGDLGSALADLRDRLAEHAGIAEVLTVQST